MESDITMREAFAGLIAEEVQRQIDELREALTYKSRFVSKTQLRKMKQIGEDTIRELETYGLKRTAVGRKRMYDLHTFDEAIKNKMYAR